MIFAICCATVREHFLRYIVKAARLRIFATALVKRAHLLYNNLGT